MISVVFGFLVGTILGSFIKATADRTIVQKSIWGRSYCIKCKSQLAWYDLLPVFSYLLLKGKCRSCHNEIPKANFLTEIFLGAVIALLFWVFVSPNINLLPYPDLAAIHFSLDIIFKIFFIGVLAVIFLIDLETGLIPDKITFPAAAITFGYLFFSHLLSPWPNLGLFILAAIGAAGFFTSLIIITKGKGMGWGDVKYVFFLGLALGFPNIIPAIFLAFLIGAIFSLGAIALGKKHFGQTIPFGPFLSLGALISLLFGTSIINWYLNALGF